MQLPQEWELFLEPYLNLTEFYTALKRHLHRYSNVLPDPPLLFNVFTFMNPQQVRVVLLGEDPYPRRTSANGVAFWDAEVKHWDDKTNGNSLKNILKALLVSQGLATYETPVSQCRRIAGQKGIVSPPELFRLWLRQGVLLVNTSLTFSGKEDKRAHFTFWKPFHLALLRALNSRSVSPWYILWGKKAQQWETEILHSIDDTRKIIKQGHPTFIHQFLRKEEPAWSPFTEIQRLTGIQWLA